MGDKRNTHPEKLSRPVQREKIPRLLFFLYAATIFINTIFRSLIPAKAAFESPHDDELGIQLSSNILNGEWLGVWDNRTFAKPSGYSIYLAVVHHIPLPLVVINQILYVIVVLLLIMSVQRIFGSNSKEMRIILFFMFSFMIFQPILFEPEANRFYRSSVPLIALTLLFSVTLFSLFQKIETLEIFPKSFSKNRKSFYLDVVILSLTYSCLFLFRYESFSLALCSLPLIFFALAQKFIKLGKNKIKKSIFLKFVIIASSLGLLSYAIPVLAVQEANRSAYGVALTENYFQGSFAEAINLWASVDVGRDRRSYVVVSAQQRNAVYKISKNAALMKPFLESNNNGWNKIACDALHLCDNSGSWFTWQVRDAAVQTGLVNSEVTFQGFFKEIADDILFSCEKSEFNCVQRTRLVGSRPFAEIPIRQILDYSLSNLKIIIPFKFNHSKKLIKPDTYGAQQEVVNLYHDVVRYTGTSFYTDNRLQGISKLVNLNDNLFIALNLLFYALALIGIVIGFIRRIRSNIQLILIFLSFGVASQLIGVSVAQISIGYAPGSTMYLLSAYPLLQMLGVVGVFILAEYLIEVKSKTKSDLKVRTKN